MIATLLSLLLSFFVPQAQDLPHAFPRDGARQLIDNDRVTVWDMTYLKGQPTPMHRHHYDMVGVVLVNSSFKVTSANGRSTTARRHVGQVMFAAKGSSDMQEGLSDEPTRAILVDLKDVTVPPLANNTGLPPGFPRDGALKLFDNARVSVWDYSWTPGEPTAMHFHDKDVVAVFLGDGETSSTTPDSVTTVSSHFPGQVTFNPRNRSHSELLPAGMQRVIAIELK